jgi:nanoRNase/pAp phosphatase (c-di-AMP/oligoRNAs hydrolase)
MKIVTCAKPFIDIDGFACCVAYAELLQLQGEEAYAVSTSKWNESITKTIHSWGAPLKTSYEPKQTDSFAIVDISDPQYFDALVDVERVEEIIDHHPGLEEFWENKIRDKAHIEFVGAASTLVCEHWKNAGLFEKMSPLSARLLLTGMLDNTLNFKAHITTERDKKAYADLFEKADLPKDWPALYFGECQQAIEANLPEAIRNDTKTLQILGVTEKMKVGQLAVWDAKQLIQKTKEVFVETMSAAGPVWFMNLISITEGKSYFLSPHKEVQEFLSSVLGIHFQEDKAEAARLWLRKEIVKTALEKGVFKK